MARELNPFDVEALERSVNDSAVRVSTIWISYLVFGLYLAIAAGGVTHRQLLLEEPTKLPVVDIELHLWSFFLLAPILFVLFHFYVLLQVLLLARTTAAYNKAIRREGLTSEGDSSLRQRLANTLFAQVLAGSEREREGMVGSALKLIAWLTLAICPVLVLLVFQFKFLPYHSHPATWIHRLLILIDLSLVILIWPLVLDPKRDADWRRLIRYPLLIASVGLVICVSIGVATFPGELHTNLFKGTPITDVCDRAALFVYFDRLDLPGVVVVDADKFAKIESATNARHVRAFAGEPTRDFRFRDLRCGDFSNADMRGVDLRGAQLSRAEFNGAQLQGARFDNADFENAGLYFANLEEASLSYTVLNGGRLREAQMRNAELDLAKLQGADLARTALQGASLIYADLEAAELDGAQLQGAHLLGANLKAASLQATQLQGANLSQANLQGANLRYAQLQGAFLQQSNLAYSLIDRTLVWRAEGSACQDAFVTNPVTTPTFGKNLIYDITKLEAGGFEEFFTATPETVANAVNEWTEDIADLEARESLRKSLISRFADEKPEDLASKVWLSCGSKAEPQPEIDKKRTAFLIVTACDAGKSLRFIRQGLLHTWQSDSRRLNLDAALNRLDADDCAAARAVISTASPSR